MLSSVQTATNVRRKNIKTLLVGALGMLALQVVLVGGYLVVDSQDPILLNPESGSLEEDGLTMVMLCGEGHTPEGRLS
jgi:heme A synthase